jgi:DNA recombination protein RmuC
MLPVLLVLQLVVLLLLVALLLRKPPAKAEDPRQLALPDQLTRLQTTSEGLERRIDGVLAQLRAELASDAAITRRANAEAAAALRTEVLQTIANLGGTLTTGLDTFRADNTVSAETLRGAVQHTLERLDQRFTAFSSEAARAQLDAQNALHAKLAALGETNTALQDKLRESVQASLAKLNTDNEAKLEQMRLTVDEKLQKTLETRLTASFGQVTTHLGEVQKGLGEMKELATGVGDLKKVLSNVSRRGGVGEFLVGQQLEQMFSPEQYLKQVNIKPATREAVDFALKFPSGELGSSTLLPIDSKFPVSDWERLEHAYDHGTAEEIAAAGKAFERAIRTQAKSICDKYIDPPTTMPHAIMVLPTEALYAEVVRRPGLQSEIQQACRVTIAGPATFMAILTSFQMGFHSLAIQKKGDEVWRVLGKAKTEFATFGTLMDRVEKQVGTVQNTLRDISGKTTTINRALKNVTGSELPTAPNVLAFDDFSGTAPLLAASVEEE